MVRKPLTKCCTRVKSERFSRRTVTPIERGSVAFIYLHLVGMSVGNQNPRVVTLKGPDNNSVRLRPWWTEKHASSPQVQSRLDVRWGCRSRTKRPIENQQRKILVG